MAGATFLSGRQISLSFLSVSRVGKRSFMPVVEEHSVLLTYASGLRVMFKVNTGMKQHLRLRGMPLPKTLEYHLGPSP